MRFFLISFAKLGHKKMAPSKKIQIKAHQYIPVFALNKKHSQEIKPQIADLADFRFLDESPSGWLQEPCEALIRVIRMNPSNGLSISEKS